MDCVVYTFVDGGKNISVGLADIDDLGDLPSLEVADPETLELALLVQVVDRLQSHLEGRLAIGRVEIENVDGARQEVSVVRGAWCWSK